MLIDFIQTCGYCGCSIIRTSLESQLRLVAAVSGLLSGEIAQMRPKATLPLFSSAPHSIRLSVWDFVFFFTFTTIKGSQHILWG